MTTHRRLLPVVVVILLVLLACDGAATVCKPAPCGCEGATKQYASQDVECTQQNWQVVKR